MGMQFVFYGMERGITGFATAEQISVQQEGSSPIDSPETTISQEEGDVLLSNETLYTGNIPEIAAQISAAEEDIREMKEVGLSTTYVSDILIEMLDEANDAKPEYPLIEERANSIEAIKQNAFYVNNLLRLKKTEILEFEIITGLNATPAWELYSKAETELRDERYDNARTALNGVTPTLDETQLEATRLSTILRAQKNRFLEWFKLNIRNILITLVVLAILIFISYKKMQMFIVRRKIDQLIIEQEVLQELMKKAQLEYFDEKRITKSMYLMKMDMYKTRIEEIKAEQPVLQAALDAYDSKKQKKQQLVSQVRGKLRGENGGAESEEAEAPEVAVEREVLEEDEEKAEQTVIEPEPVLSKPVLSKPVTKKAKQKTETPTKKENVEQEDISMPHINQMKDKIDKLVARLGKKTEKTKEKKIKISTTPKDVVLKEANDGIFNVGNTLDDIDDKEEVTQPLQETGDFQQIKIPTAPRGGVLRETNVGIFNVGNTLDDKEAVTQPSQATGYFQQIKTEEKKIETEEAATSVEMLIPIEEKVTPKKQSKKSIFKHQKKLSSIEALTFDAQVLSEPTTNEVAKQLEEEGETDTLIDKNIAEAIRLNLDAEQGTTVVQKHQELLNEQQILTTLSEIYAIEEKIQEKKAPLEVPATLLDFAAQEKKEALQLPAVPPHFAVQEKKAPLQLPAPQKEKPLLVFFEEARKNEKKEE